MLCVASYALFIGCSGLFVDRSLSFVVCRLCLLFVGPVLLLICGCRLLCEFVVCCCCCGCSLFVVLLFDVCWYLAVVGCSLLSFRLLLLFVVCCVSLLVSC